MTDGHKPSTAVVLSFCLTEASVYVLVTSVGADCYVCILSHGAIALRCGPRSLPPPKSLPPLPHPVPVLSQFTSSGPALLHTSVDTLHTHQSIHMNTIAVSILLFRHISVKYSNNLKFYQVKKFCQQPMKRHEHAWRPAGLVQSMIIAFLLLDCIPSMTEGSNNFSPNDVN